MDSMKESLKIATKDWMFWGVIGYAVVFFAILACV